MKPSESQNIHKTIYAIVKSTYTDGHVSHLFNLSANIAYSILIRKIQIYNHYFPISVNNGSTILDEAKSMISILFNRNDKNDFVELQNFFLPKLDEIGKDKEKSIPYLKQLIQSKIRQELVNRFKQEDIEGYRLYRNIQLAPKRNPKIGVFTIGYKKYYFYDDKKHELNEIYNSHEEPVTRGQLGEWYKESNRRYKTIPDIISNILKKCIDHKELQNYVSFTELLSTIKQSYKPQMVNIEMLNSLSNSASTMNHNEILLINSKLRSAIESKLVLTYIEKNKASQFEIELYAEIVMNYFEDLIHRGECLQLQNYIGCDAHKDHLKINWPIHRSRIEYLIKHGKNVLKEMIIPI